MGQHPHVAEPVLETQIMSLKRSYSSLVPLDPITNFPPLPTPCWLNLVSPAAYARGFKIIYWVSTGCQNLCETQGELDSYRPGFTQCKVYWVFAFHILPGSWKKFYLQPRANVHLKWSAWLSGLSKLSILFPAQDSSTFEPILSYHFCSFGPFCPLSQNTLLLLSHIAMDLGMFLQLLESEWGSVYGNCG